MIEGALLLARLVLGMLAVAAVGWGLLAGLLPRPESSSPLERGALGFGLGALVITLWMLAITWLGFRFSLPLVLGPPLALSGLALASALKKAPFSAWLARPTWPWRGWDWVFLALLALFFAFAALRAGLYPMWSWDALATWGLKAKAFYLGRGLDLSRLEAHNYYPNLVPLLLSYLYLCMGGVHDHLVKLVFPVWGGLTLVLLYCLLVRLGLSRRPALGVTTFFALNGTVFLTHLYLAYADLTLAFYALAGVGLTFRWMREEASWGIMAAAR